jgi:hypothetical protein
MKNILGKKMKLNKICMMGMVAQFALYINNTYAVGFECTIDNLPGYDPEVKQSPLKISWDFAGEKFGVVFSQDNQIKQNLQNFDLSFSNGMQDVDGATMNYFFTPLDAAGKPTGEELTLTIPSRGQNRAPYPQNISYTNFNDKTSSWRIYNIKYERSHIDNAYIIAKFNFSGGSKYLNKTQVDITRNGLDCNRI